MEEQPLVPLNPPIVTFDPSSLAKPDRLWLKRTAHDIRDRLKQAAGDMIAIGRLLIWARRRIGHGRYTKWLTLEIGLHMRSAQRLMRVAKVFGKLADRPEVASRIQPTVLYAMSQPDVPQPLREFIIQEAEDGKQVTPTRAQELLATYREKGRPAPISLATKDTPKPKNTNPDAAFASQNWLLLLQLVEQPGTLHITTSVDTETGEMMVSAMWLGDKGERKSATRPRWEPAMLDLLGETRVKVCRTCNKHKPIEHFSNLKESFDGTGRNKVCLQCERERVARYTANKG